ncbi:benzoyl-CoA 2,3-epoxidase subunit BoxA [Herbaspirillum sp. RTI4]|uniref:benzoyl-CoA 2,3-epoxidase subunit BoxA n=1 Tax=Herbaspirillum sp. RTI4 TaxID=3048640 RepID=UPI002AB3BDDD|nr:benzoyl-CoA 2,3-epoxidase subunit BoxA [Herbaspirillum sp. RTI4]MDY7578418.1 benzoyl-CoA 2,3-epoxidase subunit BoxA [Herbaspirillum sp. RTI4]MEA9982568.1 benzoyl-CoA 2,3-epoxidase subunit BoxA [Herbaspirillum sp. RTI4]
MNASDSIILLRQHLIDPEICIRCNTCEETCPVDAITHDSRNYVVDADKCNGCEACVSPCPTGSIDHWHVVPKTQAYSLQEQFGWDELPPQQAAPLETPDAIRPSGNALPGEMPAAPSASSSTHAPWSAAHPYLNLYSLKEPVTATVAGNFRLTAEDAESDIRHLVLDFGTQFFPLLEGQSIGIIAPGTDAAGKPHYLRMYSVASPRDGEREGYNNLSLTVKRVVQDHEGNAVRGVASNYLCDLQKGDTVQVSGPFGANYLMPNHANAHLLMICTGTGSAPMRAMTEHRRRQTAKAQAQSGKLMLFFGARKPEELPYFGPLRKLPQEFIDIHLAFSRVPDQPRAWVQDKIREAGPAVSQLLREDTYIYICGLKGMETGVMEALRDICKEAGMDWPSLHQQMVKQGRFHVETY